MKSSDDYGTSLTDYILVKVHDGDTEALRTLFTPEAHYNDYLHRIYSKPHGQKLTLLTMACLDNRQDIVRILLEHFELDLEVLNDVYLTPKIQDASMFYDVTALWAATASDHFELVKLLVEGGARVNHTTKTSSTALRCACCLGNLAMARYLIENGADIHITKENHDTNLMAAVFSRDLGTIRYLIEELSCDINECNEEGISPLYEAVRSESVEVVEYLLQHGARNFRAHSDRISPLLLAAIKQRIDLVDMISSQCSLLEQIEGKELLGSSFACEVNHRYDPERSFIYLSQALELRSLHQLPKVLTPSTLEIFGHRQECETIEQLEEVFKNTDDIHIEALLVSERLLGCIHAEHLESLRLWAVYLFNNDNYDRGLAVWMYASRLHRENSLPLCVDDVRFLVNAFSRMVLESVTIPAETVQAVFKVLLEELNDNTKDFNDHLCTLLFLITLTAQILYKSSDWSPKDRQLLLRQVRVIIQHPYAGRANGSTLLHLSVSRGITADDEHIDRCCRYPCELTARLLLQCGADVNAMDAVRDTPLHILLVHSNRNDVSTIQLLCQTGAHLDCVNALGETPIDVTLDPREKEVLKSYLKPRLKCVCARLIRQCEIPYAGKLTSSLTRFVELH